MEGKGEGRRGGGREEDVSGKEDLGEGGGRRGKQNEEKEGSLVPSSMLFSRLRAEGILAGAPQQALSGKHLETPSIFAL